MLLYVRIDIWFQACYCTGTFSDGNRDAIVLVHQLMVIEMILCVFVHLMMQITDSMCIFRS